MRHGQWVFGRAMWPGRLSMPVGPPVSEMRAHDPAMPFHAN